MYYCRMDKMKLRESERDKGVKCCRGRVDVGEGRVTIDVAAFAPPIT